MVRDDLIQSKDLAKNQSAMDFYKVAAVPLSDFVRLALLTKYGGFWVDTTVTINTNLDYFMESLLENRKNLFLYYNPWYRQNKIVHTSEELRNAGAAETWWLVSPQPGHLLLQTWLRKAEQYWLQKIPGQDISEHSMFRGSISPVQVSTIPEYLRNYLWIYLLWAQVVAENPVAASGIEARDAFENPAGVGSKTNATVGPYVWMLVTNFQIAKLSAFVGDIVAKQEGPYTQWIDKMKVIKVPGAVAKDLQAIYKSQEGIEERDNVFNYIWRKKITPP
jgi:hypothetical protein